jgi:hypothetical protein
MLLTRISLCSLNPLAVTHPYPIIPAYLLKR